MPDAPAVARPTLRDAVINPLPNQRQWLDAISQYEYLLVGGQAGPGKSYFLRWAAIELLGMWHEEGHDHVTVGLFCEDYPSLKDRQITKIKREVPRWLGVVGDSKEDGLCVFLNEKYGGGKVALRNLDDPSKYASAEFAAIFVDELTKNDRQTFDDLRFRKRWPGIDHSPFVAASNPGSKGHAWVKKLWLDKDFSGEDARLDPASFCYLPARGRDNPYLPESYWVTLNSLPEKMRKAMLDGDWDLFTGQFFAEWRRDLHVCEPFVIPKGWTRLISGDYGFAKPSSIGWYARDPEGSWWRYRELYEPGLTYPTLAQRILEHTPLDERIAYAVFDPAIWGDRAKSEELPGLSGGEQLTQALKARGIPVRRGNHDRLNGWAACRKLLQPVPAPDGRQAARFQAFSTCTHFIRTVPSLVHDEARLEDLDTDGDDHCADEWRYAVNSVAYDPQEQEHRHLAEYLAATDEIALASAHGGYGFR